MAQWMFDLTWSSEKFVKLVWPIIKEPCGGGDIRPVETLTDNALAKEMDILCGIDVWQTLNGVGARGIASRVQRGISWDTFTIRLSRASGAVTEYEKKKTAIESGAFIYPYLTCHAYVDSNNVRGIGLARTIDIFNLIESEKSAGRVSRETKDSGVWINSTNNAEFIACSWESVPNCWIYRKPLFS